MVDQAQDTLRPNNRLSDMQATMEQTQAFENRVLERLNAGKTVRSFLCYWGKIRCVCTRISPPVW